MQSNIDIVRAYFLAIDQSDLEQAAQYLADDFRQHKSSAQSLGKQEALDVQRAFKAAMPDFKHILSSIESEGALVRLTVQTGGRHMHPLSLSDLGMGLPTGIVPGSGRMIIFLPNQLEYTVVNGKIVSEKDVTPTRMNNGMTAFLNEIGYTG